jgi:hypothetical protein
VKPYEQRPNTLTEKLFLGALFFVLVACAGILLFFLFVAFGFVVCCRVTYDLGKFLLEKLFSYEQKKKTSKSRISSRSVRKR